MEVFMIFCNPSVQIPRLCIKLGKSTSFPIRFNSFFATCNNSTLFMNTNNITNKIQKEKYDL